jgi:phosphoribosyl 1,2-cyclic phosphodiesterase
MYMAKVVLLGTGSSWGDPNLQFMRLNPWKTVISSAIGLSEPKRGHSAAVYVADSGEASLIDAGPSIIGELLEHGREFFSISNERHDATTELFGRTVHFRLPRQTTATSIKHVFLTHHHDDHINGLTLLKQLATLIQAPLPVYAVKRTLDYVFEHFNYIFMGKTIIGTGDKAVPLKLVVRELPETGEVTLEDGTPVRTLDVRHGKETERATMFVFPGFVYAPDISHVTPEVIDFIVAAKPKVIVLNCQAQNRRDHGSGDNYAHLGIEEFMKCAAKVGGRLNYPVRFVSVHMQASLTNGFLKKQFRRNRDKAGVPHHVRLQVGYDGMRLKL